MSQHGLTEHEMRMINEARAQSRKEVADLERLRQQLKAIYLDENSSDEDFNQHWPELCSAALRPQPDRELNLR